MRYIINKSRRFTSPKQKPSGSDRPKFFAHSNYEIVETSAEDMIRKHCSGYHIVPAECDWKEVGGKLRIKSSECWVSQDIFIIEIDKDVTETSLQEVIDNNEFIRDNAFALTESIRSRYNDPLDDECNGELRYRVWFRCPGPTSDKQQAEWFKDRLLKEFPNADKSGSNLTGGAFGLDGANYIITGNFISQSILSEWAKEWIAYKYRPKPNINRDVSDFSDLPAGYLEEINRLTFNANNFSTQRIPCPFADHMKDGWGSPDNAASVRRNSDGSFTIKCFKGCDKSQRFGKKPKKQTSNSHSYLELFDPITHLTGEQIDKLDPPEPDVIPKRRTPILPHFLDMPKIDTIEIKEGRQTIKDALADGRRVAGIKVATGLGKSYQVIDDCATIPTVILAKTVALACEYKERADQKGIPMFHFRSRQFPGMCNKAEECDIVGNKGLNVQERVCNVCEFKTTCEYQKQFKAMKDYPNIVHSFPNAFTQPLLQGPITSLINFDGQPRRCVIDETNLISMCNEHFLRYTTLQRWRDDFAGELLGQLAGEIIHAVEGDGMDAYECFRIVESYTDEQLSYMINLSQKALVTGAVHKMKVVREGRVVSYFNLELETGHRIYIVNPEENENGWAVGKLKDEDEYYAFGSLKQRQGETVGECYIDITNLIDMGYYGDNPHNYPDLSFSQYGDKQIIEANHVLSWMKRFLSLYKDFEQAPFQWSVKEGLRFWMPPIVNAKTETLKIMSATMNNNVFGEFFLDGKIYESGVVKNHDHKDLYQIATGQYPRSSLITRNQDLDDGRWRYGSLNDTGRKFYDAANEFAKDKPVALITFKVICDMIDKGELESNFVSIRNFGAIEGLDEAYKDVQAVIILGLPEVPHDVVELDTKKVYGHNKKYIDFSHDKMGYVDDRAVSIHDAIVMAELRQAVGRARLLLPESKKVILLSGAFLDGISQQANLVDVVDLENACGDFDELFNQSQISTMQRLLRQQTEQQIIELYRVGKTRKELADMFKLTERQVEYITKDVERISNEQVVYEFIRDNPGCQQSFIVQETGLSKDKVYRTIKKLGDTIRKDGRKLYAFD